MVEIVRENKRKRRNSIQIENETEEFEESVGSEDRGE